MDTQAPIENDSKKLPAEVSNRNSRWLRVETWFWLAIGLAMITFIYLSINASLQSGGGNQQLKELKEPITAIVISNKTKDNLHNPKVVQKIEADLNARLDATYGEVDKDINLLFAPAYNDVDTFLDWHYSIKGEYTQLLAAGASNLLGDDKRQALEQIIADKIMGANFAIRVTNTADNLDRDFQAQAKAHINLIGNLATEGIDTTLNSDAFTTLKQDITRNMNAQFGKVGAMVAVRLAPQLARMLASRVVAKIAGKLALKGGVKILAKGATATATGVGAAAASAAAAGALCGPFAWVCAPVAGIAAGTAAWFATDGIIINSTEFFNRNEFKAEIIALLNEQQTLVANQFKVVYGDGFQALSENVQTQYKEAEFKEEVEVTQPQPTVMDVIEKGGR